MARRSSYETYQYYYRKATKGGRAAEKMLTKRQFERTSERLRGSGANLARRIAMDQMEVSRRQMIAARKAQREIKTEETTSMTELRKKSRDEYGELLAEIRQESGLSGKEFNDLISRIGSPKERIIIG